MFLHTHVHTHTCVHAYTYSSTKWNPVWEPRANECHLYFPTPGRVLTTTTTEGAPSVQALGVLPTSAASVWVLFVHCHRGLAARTCPCRLPASQGPRVLQEVPLLQQAPRTATPGAGCRGDPGLKVHPSTELPGEATLPPVRVPREPPLQDHPPNSYHSFPGRLCPGPRRNPQAPRLPCSLISSASKPTTS